MRAPLSVLRRFFDKGALNLSNTELARVLNARVSEVEHVHRYPAREKFSGVRIVEAVEALEHAVLPSAEAFTRWRMSLADDKGFGPVYIVVGDRFGLKVGDRAAAVLVGGTLPESDVVIQAKAVAGLASEGVLVSEAQLGVGKDAARPLFFAPDTALGADPWTALCCDEHGEADVIFEFDLEPNRPDLFSLSGIARDIGAIWGLTPRLPSGPSLGELPALDLEIRIETPRARHYAGLAMRGVRVAASPQWLQNTVRALGMRPINNVVDAANLAMFELGQPLHTFDRAQLHSSAIVLRMAAPNETITTLDGVVRTLTDECLLVCDGSSTAEGAPGRPVAIAGVMGDASSEVREGTTDILIESAAFDMAAVRRASRRLSLRTEASLRFEKGLPICTVAPALARLAGLLTELCGAAPTALSIAGEAIPAPTHIALNRAYLRQRLGMDIPDATMDRLLCASGLEVHADHALAPEFRPDLRIPQDLIEEVGRLHGYEHVRAEAPVLPLRAPDPTPQVRLARASRHVLTAAGFDEVYLPVWIGDEDASRFQLDPERLIRLINPLAANLTTFRTTALPALLEACVQNRKDLHEFGLFEVGRIYRRIPSDSAPGAIDERQHLAGISIGRDLLEVRDVLIELGKTLGASTAISRPSRPDFSLADVLHPGRSVAIGSWATIGELHPRLVRAVGLRETPVVFWADLESLLHVQPAPVHFQPPPRHPSVVLDLNVTIGNRVESASVLAAVPELPGLVHREIADVYKLDSGARVTLRFTWNGGERSMTAEETQAALGQIRGALSTAGFTL